MNVKRFTGRLLLAFVLVSIGFAVGRETAPGRAAREPAHPQQGGTTVAVTYLRSTFRCLTCNTIEALTGELIGTEFAPALAAGRLTWQTVDYMQNAELASRYNVSGNMIVVARLENGREVETRRLDRVMELAGRREEFVPYVRNAIRDLLGETP